MARFQLFNFPLLSHLGIHSVTEYGRSYKYLLLLPHLFVSGEYTVDGRILLLPISGSGKFTGNFSESPAPATDTGLTQLSSDPVTYFLPFRFLARCVADVIMNTEPRMVDGETYIFVKKLTIRVRVGSGSQLKLENLFNGDKTLGDVINQTINQNFDVVARDIIPLIERALERHFRKTANKIMSRYTEQQIFPV